MKDYRLLSVDELCHRYAQYDDERSQIDIHVNTRPEEEQAEFNDFKRRNGVGIGLESSPFEGITSADIFILEERRFIVYDEYDFGHFKYYIEERLAPYAGKPERIKHIVEDELRKAQNRLNTLQEDALSIKGREESDRNLDSRIEVDKCIAYLSNNLHPQKSITVHPDHYQSKPTPRYEAPDFSKMKAKAREYLHHLSGYNRLNKKVMTKEEYQRLLLYTDILIEKEAVPESIEPIYPVNITQLHLRYTFYQIHDSLYGMRPKRDYFIDFLYEVFPKLFNENNISKSTTKGKFSVGPKSYGRDVSDFTW